MLGEQDVFQMEHRFLNGFMLFGVLISLFAIITNILFNLQPLVILLSVVAFAVMGFFYVLSRFLKNYKTTLYSASIFILVFLSYMWIEYAGTQGPMIYLFFVLLVFLGTFFRGLMGWIMILVFTLTISGLYILEGLLPEFVTPYSGEAFRIPDHLALLLPSVAMIAFVLNLSREYYQREKVKAETSNKLKSSFLANISHEIRTPMNSIIGFSELLAENPNPEDQQRYLKIIQESGDNLLRLIDEILDISQIESGQGRIKIEKFNLEELLKDLYHTFHSIQNQRGDQNVNIILNIPDNRPVEVMVSDPLRLKQVFSNLLDNALKFTEKGSVEFGYRITTPGRIHFYVRDTGIGIAPEHHDAIFDRFHKVEDRYEKLYRGTGLGLSVCKQIVEMLEGQIRVYSEVDKGTEFVFDLPMLDEDETDHEKQVSPGRYYWPGIKLLFAEHHDLTYQLFADLLKPTSIEITRALDGTLVKTIMDEQEDLDLVLVDMNLPGNEDFKILDFIKLTKPRLPVMVFATIASPEDIKRCKDHGARDIITKPLHKETVFRMIQKYIGKKK